ncbi:MAG: aldehyde dehydrogenase family protein [Planctomycetota bacterium]
MTGSHEATLVRLHAAAASFAATAADARAELARRTALAVAAAADRWIEAAVAIKSGGELAQAAVVRAEETATGPLATLRLLLVTARAWREIATRGTPRPIAPPRIVHAGGSGSFVAVDVFPERWIADQAMFQGHRGTVRCANPGDLAAFDRSWREECRDRPRRGGVAVMLGAGNVTGLAVADAIAQVFEHGRGALVKLHPLQLPLVPVFRAALEPLVAAGLVEFIGGGPEIVADALTSPRVTHVHLTGGRAAFDAVLRSLPAPDAGVARSVTCELGGVTPWIVVPGRYTEPQLRRQADLVAGSILHNTSFNCIATKCLVTCRSWDQRDAFLEQVKRRLASVPARRSWYPGATAAWEQATATRAPADGTLPWCFRTGVDVAREPHWLEREWFAPVAVEVPLDAGDIEAFCTRATASVRRLPGSLAASVTIPESLPPSDRRRVELLVEHLEYGTVAVNTWSALGYSFAAVPWGGFPGGTLADPGSGIGFVHDPLVLPLVHNSIVRAPLQERSTPPWLPWHPHAAELARGVIDVYAAIARGGSGLWSLARMLPRVLAG